MQTLLRCCLAILLLALTVVSSSRSHADETPFPKDAPLEKLWGDGEFTEGAALGPDGAIYFSDIPGKVPGKVYRFDPATAKTTVHCAESRKSNGLVFDGQGRLLAACGANDGARALCEITADGHVKPLVSKFKGKAFNAPNDLDVHPKGWVYFSDPFYVGPEKLELDQMSVYLWRPEMNTVVRATTEITKPNGVAVSPDGKTLYVAETNNGQPKLGDSPFAAWRMTLNAFPIHDDGTLGERTILHDFQKEVGIDGMCVDPQGRIFAAVRSEKRFGIAAFDPQAKKLLGFVKTPEVPTNCCFGGGNDKETLYVTAGKSLYRIRLAK